MTLSEKKKITIWPHLEFEFVCKDKKLTNILLYASLPLIWYATWPYSDFLGLGLTPKY